MSQRELRALLADQRGSTFCNLPQRSTRSRSQAQLQQTDKSMSEEDAGVNMAERLQELERRLEMAEAENKEKDEELRRSFQELEKAGAEIQSYQTQVDRYASEIERVKVQGELEKHRALEVLREEHVGQLKFIQSQTERERERTDNWISELKERMERENRDYRERIETLESELCQQLSYATDSDNQSSNQNDSTEEIVEEDHDISALQRKDLQFSSLITFLEKGELPDNQKLAKRIVLEQSQYDLIDNILHHENPINPGHWRQVVPSKIFRTPCREKYV